MKSSYKAEDQLFLQQLGLRIRQLRSEIGLSQAKLSFECELDRTYVGSVERGERNIAIINLRKIAKALDISVAELLSFDHE